MCQLSTYLEEGVVLESIILFTAQYRTKFEILLGELFRK